MSDSLVDDVASRLVAFGGVGVTEGLTPTIFEGQMPSSPDRCTAIKSTPGMGGVYTMGRGLNALIEQHAFQVLTRDVRFGDAEGLARRVYAGLDGYEGTLNGTVYLRIVARHPPYPLGRDEQKRTVFTCNYIAQLRRR